MSAVSCRLSFKLTTTHQFLHFGLNRTVITEAATAAVLGRARVIMSLNGIPLSYCLLHCITPFCCSRSKTLVSVLRCSLLYYFCPLAACNGDRASATYSLTEYIYIALDTCQPKVRNLLKENNRERFKHFSLCCSVQKA